jgi:stage II sporulation protein R
MEPILSVADNREEARTLLEEHTADMEAVGLAVIQEEGYDYDIQVYLTKEEFPVKSYGDLLFPSGEYEALRVDIGNHEGGNWWCVMYPGLCFVETAGGVVATEGKEELQQVLTPEQYETLILYPDEDDQIEYRSYIWDKLVNKK